MRENYETLLDVINDLRQRGFDHDFYLNNQGLYSPTLQRHFTPDQVTLTNYFRFEGMSYPGDNEILYTIRTNEGDHGILVCPYGVYADSAHFLPILKIERQISADEEG